MHAVFNKGKDLLDTFKRMRDKWVVVPQLQLQGAAGGADEPTLGQKRSAQPGS